MEVRAMQRPARPLGRLEITLTRSEASGSIARMFVNHRLRLWGMGGLADDAVNIVGELYANAVTHTKDDQFFCVLDYNGSRPRLEMWDSSDEVPVVKEPDFEAEIGRGMYLINELSAQWGVRKAAAGKCVWVILV